MRIVKGNRSDLRYSFPIAFLSTTDHMCPNLGMNPGYCGGVQLLIA